MTYLQPDQLAYGYVQRSLPELNRFAQSAQEGSPQRIARSILFNAYKRFAETRIPQQLGCSFEAQKSFSLVQNEYLKDLSAKDEYSQFSKGVCKGMTIKWLDRFFARKPGFADSSKPQGSPQRIVKKFERSFIPLQKRYERTGLFGEDVAGLGERESFSSHNLEATIEAKTRYDECYSNLEKVEERFGGDSPEFHEAIRLIQQASGDLRSEEVKGSFALAETEDILNYIIGKLDHVELTRTGLLATLSSSKESGTAHAVGLTLKKGSAGEILRFMDPNHGEFSFNIRNPEEKRAAFAMFDAWRCSVTLTGGFDKLSTEIVEDVNEFKDAVEETTKPETFSKVYNVLSRALLQPFMRVK